MIWSTEAVEPSVKWMMDRGWSLGSEGGDLGGVGKWDDSSLLLFEEEEELLAVEMCEMEGRTSISVIQSS